MLQRSFDSVPVVDLQDFETATEDFVQLLGDAIRYFGFVRVKGHSVDKKICDPAYRVAKNFFSKNVAWRCGGPSSGATNKRE